MLDTPPVSITIVVIASLGCAAAVYAIARIFFARARDGFADRNLGKNAKLLNLVLTNMSQGLCVLMVANSSSCVTINIARCMDYRMNLFDQALRY